MGTLNEAATREWSSNKCVGANQEWLMRSFFKLTYVVHPR